MIIEHRTFALVDGVDEATFLAADARVQTEVAPFQDGFVRRTTARGPDGRWLVETMWGSEDTCEAADRVAHDAVSAVAACIAPGSERVERWATLD